MRFVLIWRKSKPHHKEEGKRNTQKERGECRREWEDTEGMDTCGEKLDSRDSPKAPHFSVVSCPYFPSSLIHARDHIHGFMRARQVFCPSVPFLWFD